MTRSQPTLLPRRITTRPSKAGVTGSTRQVAACAASLRAERCLGWTSARQAVASDPHRPRLGLEAFALCVARCDRAQPGTRHGPHWPWQRDRGADCPRPARMDLAGTGMTDQLPSSPSPSCSACAHFQGRLTCSRPVASFWNPATNQRRSRLSVDARIERSTQRSFLKRRRCGPEGLFFEPKG